MGTSIQRLLIMTVAIWVVLAICQVAYHNGSDFSSVEKQLGIGNNWTSNTISGIKETNPDTSGYTLNNKDYGNTKSGGGKIFDLLSSGFGLMPITATNPAERVFEYIFNWVFIVINMVLVIEAFFIIYSKKWS